MQHGMHGPIFESDEAEAVVSQLPSIQKTQTGFSPSPNHLAEKCGLVEIDFFFERLRNRDGAACIERNQFDKLSITFIRSATRRAPKE